MSRALFTIRHASHEYYYYCPHAIVAISSRTSYLLPETPTSTPDTPAVMLDSQQDTTSPGAWQRHCDEETVCHASLITHQTKPVPPSNLQESLALNLSSSSSHGRPRQPASPTLAGSPRENANPNNPSPQSLGTCLWHSACLSLTFSSAPNQPDPLACRKPKKSVSRAAHSDLSSHNPSWLHEIALMHAKQARSPTSLALGAVLGSGLCPVA